MNMSFFMTSAQYRAGTKTVTRRLGWRSIKIGVVHKAVLKGQGLKRGEKIEVLGQFIPVSSRWEPLQRLLDEPQYGAEEMVREGFPGMSPAQFVSMLCKHYKCTPEKEFNRIEFVYV